LQLLRNNFTDFNVERFELTALLNVFFILKSDGHYNRYFLFASRVYTLGLLSAVMIFVM